MAKRVAEEAQFATWVAGSTERQKKYGEVLPELKRLSDATNATSKRDVILGRFPSPALTPVFKQVFDAVTAVQQGRVLTAAPRAAKQAEIQEAFKDREPVYEREMIKFFLKELCGTAG